jgi:hypothetical protein
MRDTPLLTLIETGGVNDQPVIVPPADTSEALTEAIKTVKAAGYHIRKPRKQMQRTRKRVGPTFVAKFQDGTVTRMSVFTPMDKLDWDRGVRLSQAAYQSRWRAQYRKRYGEAYPVDPPIPPAIVATHFEQDGVVLAQRNGGSEV